MAFGSAAPELFLNSVSAVAHTSDLSMAAILGSGIIAFGLIPSACILSAPRAQIKLHLYPILREVRVIYLFFNSSMTKLRTKETNQHFVYFVVIVAVYFLFDRSVCIPRFYS